METIRTRQSNLALAPHADDWLNGRSLGDISSLGRPTDSPSPRSALTSSLLSKSLDNPQNPTLIPWHLAEEPTRSKELAKSVVNLPLVDPGPQTGIRSRARVFPWAPFLCTIFFRMLR